MDSFWLDIDGNMLEVDDFGHNRYASDLLDEEMGEEELEKFMEENHINYPFAVLHLRGWVRVKISPYAPRIEVLGNCIDLTKPMRNTMNPAMNERQLRVVKELCDQYDTPFHVAINDKRFW